MPDSNKVSAIWSLLLKSAIPVILIFSISALSADVVINEYMASNGRYLPDEDGHYEDWIEFYNHGEFTVDLAGFGLTDDPGRPFRWEFPSVAIEPGAFLVVWASGKDRRNPGSNLHTNFSISREGEPIQLTAPDGRATVLRSKRNLRISKL